MFDSANLRIAIVPLRCIADTKLKINVSSGRLPTKQWLFQVNPPGSGAAKKLVSLLEKLEDIADILIFPELIFSELLLETLQAWLKQRFHELKFDTKIKMVIAGSYHQDKQNICYICGPDGRIVWRQNKLNRYQLLAGEYKDNQKIMNDGGVEDLRLSKRELKIVDFSFGRVSALICLDFITPEIFNILAALRVNCFFIPTMSSGISKFETLAEWHGTISCSSTFLSNAFNIDCHRPGQHSFIYLPAAGKNKAFHYLDYQEVDGQESIMVFDTKDFSVESLQIETV